MNLFAVVFDPEEETTRDAIDYAKRQSEGDGYLCLCHNVLLINFEGSAHALARKLNLSSESDFTAVVFLLDGQTAGYYRQSVWKWLDEDYEEV